MMFFRLSSPCQLVISTLLLGVFLSSPSTVAEISAGETFSSTLISAPGDERHQRRETWDLFGFLMMAVDSQCGITAQVRLGDHPLCRQCNNGYGDSCQSLCDMKDSEHKSHYSRYCEDSEDTTTTQSSTADSYVGNSETGSVTTGNYSKGFQFWMVATAAAVGMAIVAVHIGQRKEKQGDEIADDESSVGASVTGSVGRRFSAISAFADGVKPTNNKQVELAEYQLESDTPQESTPSPPSYPQSQFV